MYVQAPSVWTVGVLGEVLVGSLGVPRRSPSALGILGGFSGVLGGSLGVPGGVPGATAILGAVSGGSLRGP